MTGNSLRPPKIPHASWTAEERHLPHCRRIAAQLIRLGVPEQLITCDERPSHSYEEALCVREFLDTHAGINSVLFVSKSFGAGRQYRTLQQNLPAHLTLIPYPFETNLGEGANVTRENWMDTPLARAFILAEYQRVLEYGARGHLTPLAAPLERVEDIELP